MENKICPILIATGNPALNTMCGKDLCAWWVPTCDGGRCAIQFFGAAEAVKHDL